MIKFERQVVSTNICAIERCDKSLANTMATAQQPQSTTAMATTGNRAEPKQRRCEDEKTIIKFCVYASVSLLHFSFNFAFSSFFSFADVQTLNVYKLDVLKGSRKRHTVHRGSHLPSNSVVYTHFGFCRAYTGKQEERHVNQHDVFLFSRSMLSVSKQPST